MPAARDLEHRLQRERSAATEEAGQADPATPAQHRQRIQHGGVSHDIEHAVDSLPATTEIWLRNRAIIAFTILTGARDSAIASMRLKHVDLIANCVNQDAREAKTKRSKTFTTIFFPVGDEIRRIVAEWVVYLRENKLWGNDDPLFPATDVALDANRQFQVSGLRKAHWTTATPIRGIFREAFANAGLPYFNPHSFRKTLALLGGQRCKTPEEYKAWSQNLGHDNCLTTFPSYGEIQPSRQAEIIRGLAKPIEATDGHVPPDLLRRLVEQLERNGAAP